MERELTMPELPVGDETPESQLLRPLLRLSALWYETVV
jgi:hypothetical protein